MFTACNTQENTQETSNTQIVTQSPETVVDDTSSQVEQSLNKVYVGEWNCSFTDFGEEVNTVINIKDDNTFVVAGDDNWKSYGGIIIKSQAGTYIEESDNKIKLTINEVVTYNPRTEKTEIETITSDTSNSGNIAYCNVKDNNTLILENEIETIEISRIN